MHLQPQQTYGTDNERECALLLPQNPSLTLAVACASDALVEPWRPLRMQCS